MCEHRHLTELKRAESALLSHIPLIRFAALPEVVFLPVEPAAKQGFSTMADPFVQTFQTSASGSRKKPTMKPFMRASGIFQEPTQVTYRVSRS